MAKQATHVFVNVTRTAQAAGKPTESAYFAEGGLVIARSDVIALQGKTIYYTTAIDLGEIVDMDRRDDVQIFKTDSGNVLALQGDKLFRAQVGAVAEEAEAPKRGRAAAEDDEPAEEEAPKRRGRPPKNVEAADEAPKRRGRPPKARDEAPVEIDDEDETPRRGRRVEAEDEEERPVRRGRPAASDDLDDEPAPARRRASREEADDEDEDRPARRRASRDDDEDEAPRRRASRNDDPDEADEPGFDVDDGDDADPEDDDRSTRRSSASDDDEVDDLF